ncbi:MAG: hypothetical protein IKO40_05465 [Kiritimatiellae bacterium]|nr:hypothetical protein [Kiritimatiellia bacterium]
MKGARVGAEKSHVQDDVRWQKSQMSGVVRADFRQKLLQAVLEKCMIGCDFILEKCRIRPVAFKNASAICMDVFCGHIGRKLRAGFHPSAENGKISVET